jgi:cell division protein FtsB
MPTPAEQLKALKKSKAKLKKSEQAVKNAEKELKKLKKENAELAAYLKKVKGGSSRTKKGGEVKPRPYYDR